MRGWRTDWNSGSAQVERQRVEQPSDPGQPQHGAHPLGDGQRLLGVGRAAARSPSASVRRRRPPSRPGPRHSPPSPRNTNRSATGSSVGQVAPEEAPVADRRRGVDGRRGEREPAASRPAADRRTRQRDRGLVEPAALGEHPGLEPPDRLGVGRRQQRRRAARAPRRCCRPRSRRRRGCWPGWCRRCSGAPAAARAAARRRGPRARSRSPSRSARPASANWRCAQPVGVRTGWASARAVATHRRASSASPTSSADDTRARWASGRSRAGSAPSPSRAMSWSPIDGPRREARRSRHRPEPAQQDPGRQHRVVERLGHGVGPRRRGRFERALST